MLAQRDKAPAQGHSGDQTSDPKTGGEIPCFLNLGFWLPVTPSGTTTASEILSLYDYSMLGSREGRKNLNSFQ